jgi:hypothetical protein
VQNDDWERSSCKSNSSGKGKCGFAAPKESVETFAVQATLNLAKADSARFYVLLDRISVSERRKLSQ